MHLKKQPYSFQAPNQQHIKTRIASQMPYHISHADSFCLFVWFGALCLDQQFFSHVWTIACLPGLNQYQAADKVSCSRTQHSDSGESRTGNPLIPSLNLYQTEPLHSTR